MSEQRGAGAEHIPKLLTHSGGRIMAQSRLARSATLVHAEYTATSQHPSFLRFSALLALLNAFIHSRKDKRQ